MRKRIPISDLLFEYDERLGNSEEPVVLSLTEKNGFVPQTERFNKRLATNDSTNYKIVRRFDLAYNQYLLWAGAIAQNKNWDVGIVSPAYPTFRVHYGFDPRYVEWLLTGDPIRLRYDAISFGAVPRRRRAKVSDFLSIAVPEPPPLSEQKRIAGILDAADALRAKRREALAQLDTLLQSTFLDMFGDPVTNPMGWEVVRFERIGSSRLGKMLDKKKALGTCQFHYLANFNVQWGRFELRDLRKMDFNEDDREEFDLQNGDLLICEGGEVGRTAIWRCERENVFFQKALHRVRLNPSMGIPEFFQYYMWFMAKNGGFRDFTNTSTIAHLTGVKLKRLPVPLPPLTLQRRFAAILESIERQKAAMRAHLAELDTLFASLQSRAFNGEL